MLKDSNWLPWFRNIMISLMLSMAVYCIYSDGFSRYTWLQHASLAGLLWVLTPTGVPLSQNLHVRSPRFWVSLAAISGMIADLFIVNS
jgi:hypothetical protein